jgi:hypothetical protein
LTEFWLSFRATCSEGTIPEYVLYGDFLDCSFSVILCDTQCKAPFGDLLEEAELRQLSCVANVYEVVVEVIFVVISCFLYEFGVNKIVGSNIEQRLVQYKGSFRNLSSLTVYYEKIYQC